MGIYISIYPSPPFFTIFSLSFYMPDIHWIIIFLLLGAVVGLMAGLLGVGGGGIMVPVLTAIFLAMHIPVDKVVHLALGTSMASIVITSFASLRAHHARAGVIWDIVKRITPGILLGTFLATFLAAYMNSRYLALFFSVFMAIVSTQMFLNKKPAPGRSRVGTLGLFLAGNFIGAISALVSIGGGSLTVPFLAWQNIQLKKAIGTSAAIGLPIALAGTLGYIINGWGSHYQLANTIGFVYLPAVFLISLVSFFTAPVGAQLAHKLPVATLKKIFAFLLLSLSIKMLYSVWQ